MSNAQVTSDTRPLLVQPNFHEVRSSSGKLLFELDRQRMIIRMKIGRNKFEYVDLLSIADHGTRTTVLYNNNP